MIFGLCLIRSFVSWLVEIEEEPLYILLAVLYHQSEFILFCVHGYPQEEKHLEPTEPGAYLQGVETHSCTSVNFSAFKPHYQQISAIHPAAFILFASHTSRSLGGSWSLPTGQGVSCGSV